MLAERPVDTVNRWILGDWQVNDIDHNDLVTRLHSISNETNRVPDSRPYLIRNGLLIDQDTNDPILAHIAPGVEYEVAEELQRRVVDAEEGIFIWHSPKLRGVYPCNKTMIYQIVYNEKLEKVLLYSAILYDGDIPNSEEQRKTLISAPDEDATFWGVLSWVESVSKQKHEVAGGASRETATYFAEQIRAGADPRTIVEEMQASGFLGQNSISCPGKESFSNYSALKGNILIFSLGKERSWSFDKSGKCVVCKEYTKVGPCDVCEACNNKIDTKAA